MRSLGSINCIAPVKSVKLQCFTLTESLIAVSNKINLSPLIELASLLYSSFCNEKSSCYEFRFGSQHALYIAHLNLQFQLICLLGSSFDAKSVPCFTCIDKPMLKKIIHFFFCHNRHFVSLYMLTSLVITLKCVMERKTHKYISKLEEAELIPILVQLTFGV